MKTFIITWSTNYGSMVMIVNFDDMEEANSFAMEDHRIWRDYEIIELSSDHGEVFFGGGDN